MSHRLATPDRGAPHEAAPLAKVLLAAALLAVLSGLVGLVLVTAAPQGHAQAGPSTLGPATASAQDRAMPRGDPSVPDASSVFAGWHGAFEESAPTF